MAIIESLIIKIFLSEKTEEWNINSKFEYFEFQSVSPTDFSDTREFRISPRLENRKFVFIGKITSFFEYVAL